MLRPFFKGFSLKNISVEPVCALMTRAHVPAHVVEFTRRRWRWIIATFVVLNELRGIATVYVVARTAFAVAG